MLAIIRCSIFFLPVCQIKVYRSIITFVVVYGCETWSLTLGEERRLRVSENWVLRSIFVPKRDEVTGEQRKLHNEEFNDLYFSPNTVRMIISSRCDAVSMGKQLSNFRRCFPCPFQGTHSLRRIFPPTDRLYYMNNGDRIRTVMWGILWMVINKRI